MSSAAPPPAGSDAETQAKLSPPWIVRITLGLIVVSIVLVTVHGATGVIPLAILSLIAITLMRLLPIRFPPLDVLAQRSQAQVRKETRSLLIYALIFPVLTVPFLLWGRLSVVPVLPAWSAGGWVFSWNFLLCKVLLLLIPTLIFIVRLRSSGTELGVRRITSPWRWLGPLLGASPIYGIGAILPLALFLIQIGPLVPLGVIAVAVVFVLLAGAFSEEYFYRVLLQTRLERLQGRWNGIAISSILFGLFHLPLHYATLTIATGDGVAPQFLWVLAGIFANQVVIGLFFGYLWSRYRNGWMNVGVHLAYDAIVTILILSGA